MAEGNSDELADALARMASGDVAPSEHEPAPAPPPPPAVSAPIRAVRPATARPAAPRPAAPVPQAPAPVAPPTPPAAPPRIRPAAPASQPGGPSSPPPVIRPAMPVARKPRPAAPVIASPPVAAPPAESVEAESIPVEVSDTQSDIINDDDMMAMPAPEAIAYEPKSKNVLADARAKIAAKRSLEMRRTLIPILLTSGVMMLGFASLKLIADPDSSLASVPIWVPILLVGGAMILIGLAVINMLSVRQQLKK